MTRFDLTKSNISIVATCCALCTICEVKGEALPAGWQVAVNLLSTDFEQLGISMTGRVHLGLSARVRKTLREPLHGIIYLALKDISGLK